MLNPESIIVARKNVMPIPGTQNEGACGIPWLESGKGQLSKNGSGETMNLRITRSRIFFWQTKADLYEVGLVSSESIYI